MIQMTGIIFYWLAINLESVSIADLASDIVTSSFQCQLPPAIKSLLQRSLIEKSGKHFFLQPVVMEYMTQRLIEQLCQEIKDSGILTSIKDFSHILPQHYSLHASFFLYGQDCLVV